MILLLAIFALVLLILYLGKKELFGTGDRAVAGYYIVEWSAPADAEDDLTYSISIKENGTVVESADNLTETKYLFKTGDWNKKYNISVNAVNKGGAGPAISTTLNSGSGPFLPVTDIQVHSTNNQNFKAGVPFSTNITLLVKWDPSVTGPDGLSGVDFGVKGTFTSTDGFTCNIVPTNIKATYAVEDGGYNGKITGVKMDGGRCTGLVVLLKEGDKLEVELTFDNQFGSTSFKKEFVVKYIKPNAPENLKVSFLKQA